MLIFMGLSGVSWAALQVLAHRRPFDLMWPLHVFA